MRDDALLSTSLQNVFTYAVFLLFLIKKKKAVADNVCAYMRRMLKPVTGKSVHIETMARPRQL